MEELDLIEQVAREMFDDAMSDLKRWMHYAGVEINLIKYDDVDEQRKEMLRSKAIKLIAIVRRGYIGR